MPPTSRQPAPVPTGESNRYSQELRRRQDARAAGADPQAAVGLHRNAGEAAFASLMMSPLPRASRSGGAARAPILPFGAPQALAPRSRRRLLWVGIVGGLLVAQGLILAGWFLVLSQ